MITSAGIQCNANAEDRLTLSKELADGTQRG